MVDESFKLQLITKTALVVRLLTVQTSRRDLLAVDFEGVLKYFRVQLPKRYKLEEAALELMQIAVSMKVTLSVCYMRHSVRFHWNSFVYIMWNLFSVIRWNPLVHV